MKRIVFVFALALGPAMTLSVPAKANILICAAHVRFWG
jgi:hypothetical protein